MIIWNGPGQAARVNAAMGCEGNGTSVDGPSEPHMRRVHESLSVCTYQVISDGTDGSRHVSRSVKEQGDTEEHRDEVWPHILPINRRKPGHAVNGGDPTEQTLWP